MYYRQNEGFVNLAVEKMADKMEERVVIPMWMVISGTVFFGGTVFFVSSIIFGK